jgi:hypothetical protein
VGVRTGLPSVGVTQFSFLGTPGALPYTLEKSGGTLTLEHVTDYTPPRKRTFRRKLQRSGSLNVMVVGSNVAQVNDMRINANLWANDVTGARTKFNALDNFVAGVSPVYFGRNGYYYTGFVDGIDTQIRVGGAGNVIPVTIDFKLIYPEATLGKPTSLSEYNASTKGDLLEFTYPIEPITFAWLTPTTLPNAEIGEIYYQRVVANSDLPITYAITASDNAGIEISTNGFIFWDKPVPIPANAVTVTVRATELGGAFLDRTFTINMSGNVYADGDFAIEDGERNILGW